MIEFIVIYIHFVYTMYILYQGGFYMHVQKWGNSLAIRLPKALCQAVSIEEGNELEFHIVDNEIVFKKTLSLEDMLKGITPNTYHKETFNDEAVGKEEW